MSPQTQFKKWLPVLLAASLSALRGNCQEIASRQEAKSHYDTDAKTYYSVFNDSAELHVQIMTIDPAQQRKILLNGLELWLDPKGKKNKSTGILFPVPAKPGSNTPSSFQPFSPKDTGRADEKKMLRSLVQSNREMKLLNFGQSAGLSVSLHFAGDTLVYQADIPFSVFSPALVFNKSLGIGIIEKGMQLPDFGGNEMAGGGGPGGGGPGGGGPGGDGGPPGGGMMPDGPPPGGFPGEDDMQKLFADNKIWFRIVLMAGQKTQ